MECNAELPWDMLLILPQQGASNASKVAALHLAIASSTRRASHAPPAAKCRHDSTGTGCVAARQQAQTFKSISRCQRSHSAASLGIVPAPQGIIVYRGVYFGLYDTAKGVLFDDERRANFFAKWAVAQTVTAPGGRGLLPLRYRPPAAHDAGAPHESRGAAMCDELASGALGSTRLLITAAEYA